MIRRRAFSSKNTFYISIVVLLFTKLLFQQQQQHQSSSILFSGSESFVPLQLTTTLVPSGIQECFVPRNASNLQEFLNRNRLERLPKPWIHIGLPKVGTTTLEHFWKCGLNRQPGDDFVSHSTCKVTSKDLRKLAFGGRGIPKNPNRKCPSNKVAPCEFCGKCMSKARNRSMPLLTSCGNYSAWAQMDTAESCFYPQLGYLDQLHQEQPRATFIFMFRNIEKWVKSVSHFRSGTMIQNLDRCRPLYYTSRDHLEDWFCQAVNHARSFVLDHPSHAYLEIDLDDPSSSRLASQAFGIEESCWGAYNINRMIHNNVSQRY